MLPGSCVLLDLLVHLALPLLVAHRRLKLNPAGRFRGLSTGQFKATSPDLILNGGLRVFV